MDVIKTHLLFVIYGTSGAGKTTLMEILQQITPNVTIHRKDTNRNPRDIAEMKMHDFHYVEDFNKDDYEIIYHKNGYYYGIQKSQLVKAFENKERHFIIMSDIRAIKQMKLSYPDTKAIYIQSNAEDILSRLKKSRNSAEFRARSKKLEQSFREYTENNTLFDHVVINYGDIDGARKQFQNILNYYIKKQAPIL